MPMNTWRCLIVMLQRLNVMPQRFNVMPQRLIVMNQRLNLMLQWLNVMLQWLNVIIQQCNVIIQRFNVKDQSCNVEHQRPKGLWWQFPKINKPFEKSMHVFMEFYNSVEQFISFEPCAVPTALRWTSPVSSTNMPLLRSFPDDLQSWLDVRLRFHRIFAKIF